MDFFGILFDMKNGKKVPYSKTYFDTLFAAKLAEMQIKTLTGTLPLTFRTSETALRSWTIYGNNYEHTYSAEGTLPLTFTTHTAGAASDWVIEGNDDVGENICGEYIELATVNVSGEVINHNNYDIGLAQVDRDKTYSFYRFASDVNAIYAFYESKPVTGSVSYNNTRVVSRLLSGSFTSPITGWVAFCIQSNTGKNLTIVKGSTAPDHYIPYQQGVGERTENKFQVTASTQTITDVTFTVNAANGSVTASGTAEANRDFFVQGADKKPIANLNNGDTLKCYDLTQGGFLFLAFYGSNGSYISQISVTSAQPSTTVIIPANAATYRFYIRKQAGISEDITFYMLLASTAPATYIPHGYKIPINISQAGQTDKTVDIYIGDTPLTAGETVSKTSTGIDLDLFEGENTVSTTLYNKPEMSITGIDYVGVGEPVNDSWQIPLSVTDGTNTTTVNVPINAPLTDGQSVSDTLTINTFEGENVLDTTLENKPQMSITYKGG